MEEARISQLDRTMSCGDRGVQSLCLKKIYFTPKGEEGEKGGRETETGETRFKWSLSCLTCVKRRGQNHENPSSAPHRQLTEPESSQEIPPCGLSHSFYVLLLNVSPLSNSSIWGADNPRPEVRRNEGGMKETHRGCGGRFIRIRDLEKSPQKFSTDAGSAVSGVVVRRERCATACIPGFAAPRHRVVSGLRDAKIQTAAPLPLSNITEEKMKKSVLPPVNLKKTTPVLIHPHAPHAPHDVCVITSAKPIWSRASVAQVRDHRGQRGLKTLHHRRAH
ncbi:unnamed protein product [Pleuronectes platessa]|uniref:Uncharacterized protein n=1 Tax=Pleuronectes platessa TaxID=8262 RepID=A0A9N7U252_PLEPL|nr:unnamed protein product [Pleuronectes platessa]